MASNQPAAAAQAAPDVFQFEVTRHVTVPTLSVEENTKYYVRIEGKIVVAEDTGKRRKRYDDAGKEIEPPAPPRVCRVLNLRNMQLMQLVVGELLNDNLSKYKNDSYVGKCFEIEKLALKGQGQNKYRPWNINEIKLKGAAAAELAKIKVGESED